MKTQSQTLLSSAEKTITLYRFFGSLYSMHNGQTWAPYLKRGIPCTIWNDNKQLSEQTFKDADLSYFSKEEKSIELDGLRKDDKNLCFLFELQTCVVTVSVWEWASSIDKKKISKERKRTHFAYENGGQDLDEYIWNEVNYLCETYKEKAFYLNGKKVAQKVINTF